MPGTRNREGGGVGQSGRLLIVKRRLFKFCSAFSFLVCIGMFVLWARSYRVVDEVDIFRINPAGEMVLFHTNSFNGGLEFDWSHMQGRKSDPAPWTVRHETGDPNDLQIGYPILSAPIMGFEFASESSPANRFLGAVLPYWAATVVFSLMPFLGVTLSGVKKHRLRAAKTPGFEVMHRGK